MSCKLSDFFYAIFSTKNDFAASRLYSVKNEKMNSSDISKKFDKYPQMLKPAHPPFLGLIINYVTGMRYRHDIKGGIIYFNYIHDFTSRVLRVFRRSRAAKA